MSEKDCLFCKIVNKEIPAKIVDEGKHWLAFEDINPAAPSHILVVPQKHTRDFSSATVDLSAEEWKDLLSGMARVAQAIGADEYGYRLVTNNGESSGQSVFHLHFHLLSKRRMGWPPG